MDRDFKISMEDIEKVFSPLNDKQKLLVADTIVAGGWGDCDMEFDTNEAKYCYVFVTNLAYMAGHFSRRSLSGMFRAIYRKLESDEYSKQFVCHCNDWWGDGSGDVMFLRGNDEPWVTWAKKTKEEITIK